MNEKNILGCIFETPMSKYYYDTNRNAIICISESTYEYLKNNMHEDITKLENIPTEIQTMIQEGFVSGNRVKKIEHSLTDYLSDILDNKLQTLTLQVTQQCNLRCDYCMYSGKKELTMTMFLLI